MNSVHSFRLIPSTSSFALPSAIRDRRPFHLSSPSNSATTTTTTTNPAATPFLPLAYYHLRASLMAAAASSTSPIPPPPVIPFPSISSNPPKEQTEPLDLTVKKSHQKSGEQSIAAHFHANPNVAFNTDNNWFETKQEWIKVNQNMIF